MEYTRDSSQPATVNLVRADLAEIWTIDESELPSPRKAPSVSGVSDMLDLEFLPTPRPRHSKAMKRDPLYDIVNEYLELSPSPERGQNDRHGKPATDRSSEQGDDGIAPNEQSRGRSNSDAIHTHSPSPTGLDGPPPSRTQKPEPSSSMALAPPNANKRKHSHQPAQAATTKSDAKSPVSRPRGQRQPNSKPAAPSVTCKAPAKANKKLEIPGEAAYHYSTRPRTKDREHGDDLFELSDMTDTEADSRPKKRPAKQPAPKKRSAPSTRKFRANKATDSPLIQKTKPARPSRTQVSRGDKAETVPSHSETAAHTDQKKELEITFFQHEDEKKSAVTKSNSNERPWVDCLGSAPQEATSLKAFASPGAQKSSPIAKGETKPVLPILQKPRNLIILSSESVDTDDAFTALTSPMFIEQNQKHVAERDPPVTITVNMGSPDQKSPIQLPMNHEPLGYTTPPSFQPRARGNNTSPGHVLPTKIRDVFLLDEQLAAVSPSPAPQLASCSEEENLSPEDVWEQTIQEDSPPAILHRIVKLLHRSLKPKEEIVRDIALDYQENALRLFENLNARHRKEKDDTWAALRKASRATVSVFSSASQDIAILIGGLRDMNTTHTEDTLRRPVLAEKLNAVTRLCQRRPSKYTRSGSLGDDVATESEDSLDDLAEAYRLRLVEAIGQSNDQTLAPLSNMGSQVDEFIRSCLHGDAKKAHRARTEAKKTNRPATSADEALGVFLDDIINTLQEKRDDDNIDQVAVKKVVDAVSEDSNMGDMIFLG